MGKAEALTEFEKGNIINESSKPRGIGATGQAGQAPAMDVDHIFTYHPPTGNQPDRYNSVREGARIFAHIILANTKPSPEQTLAIRKLQEATMFANASIALEK